MPTIDVYVKLKQVKLNKFIDTIESVLLGKWVLVGLLLTKALNKVIKWYIHMLCKNLSFTILQQLIDWVYTQSITSLSEAMSHVWKNYIKKLLI